MMMALGLFVFGLHTVPYQQLQRQMSWRHPSVSRVGRRPARQFTGPGDDVITLSGVLYPELTGGKISLAALQAMANEGKAWPLIEGTGIFYGLFVIEEISQTDSLFFADGAPRKIEFSMKLTRVDDEPDLLGQITSSLLEMLDLK
ncbi:MAG: phage tail protein [Rhodocyclales bacterium]|nr:phage tail protein [Rhodocyclales bacterium]